MKEYQINNLLNAYRDGTISEEDRFLLEKQALDDPFLFDALEGLSASEERTPTRRSPQYIKWIGYAASLLVVAGVTFFFMQSDGDIAQEQSQVIASNDIQKEVEGQKESTKLPAPKEHKAKVSQNIQKSKKRVTTTFNAPSKSTSKNQISQQDYAETEVKTQSIPANPKSEGSSEGMTAQIENDMDADTPISGGMPMDEIAEVVEEEIAVLDENAQAKSKVNVVSKSNTHPQGYTDDKAEAVSSRALIDAEPMIGNKDFEEYLQENIKQRGMQQTPTQHIIIEFSLDENGRATDFMHIVENEPNVCTECEAYAIALLQKSGVWKTNPPKKEGRVRYKVKF